MTKEKKSISTEKAFDIADVADSLNLTKTELTKGKSLCSFWKTKYDKIFITDYNFKWSEFDKLKEANLLKDRGNVTMFYTNKGVFVDKIISALILKDTDFMLKLIDDFYNECSLKS